LGVPSACAEEATTAAVASAKAAAFPTEATLVTTDCTFSSREHDTLLQSPGFRNALGAWELKDTGLTSKLLATFSIAGCRKVAVTTLQPAATEVAMAGRIAQTELQPKLRFPVFSV